MMVLLSAVRIHVERKPMPIRGFEKSLKFVDIACFSAWDSVHALSQILIVLETLFIVLYVRRIYQTSSYILFWNDRRLLYRGIAINLLHEYLIQLSWVSYTDSIKPFFKVRIYILRVSHRLCEAWNLLVYWMMWWYLRNFIRGCLKRPNVVLIISHVSHIWHLRLKITTTRS